MIYNLVNRKSLKCKLLNGEFDMFIGREKELENLNRLYASDKFEFAVLYGRRRVGKTAIINEFI